MGGEQDMRKMGGLAKKMPITYATMLMATIAISGIPPFAGFFSKDEILWRAFTFPYFPEMGKIIWFMGTLGAGITAFYMFRLIFMTFHGEFRGTKEQAHHLHESPYSMTGPLMILAFLSLIGGWFGISPLVGNALGGGIPNMLEHFLEPVFEHSQKIIETAAPVPHYTDSTEWLLMALSVLTAAGGIIGAFFVYVKKFPELPKRLAEAYNFHYKLVYNKYYIDEIYYLLVVCPIYYLSVFLWKIVDVFLIDGVGINGQAWLVQKGSGTARYVQNGSIQTYAAFILMGLVAILWYFFKLS